MINKEKYCVTCTHAMMNIEECTACEDMNLFLHDEWIISHKNLDNINPMLIRFIARPFKTRISRGDISELRVKEVHKCLDGLWYYLDEAKTKSMGGFDKEYKARKACLKYHMKSAEGNPHLSAHMIAKLKKASNIITSNISGLFAEAMMP